MHTIWSGRFSEVKKVIKKRKFIVVRIRSRRRGGESQNCWPIWLEWGSSKWNDRRVSKSSLGTLADFSNSSKETSSQLVTMPRFTLSHQYSRTTMQNLYKTTAKQIKVSHQLISCNNWNKVSMNGQKKTQILKKSPNPNLLPNPNQH